MSSSFVNFGPMFMKKLLNFSAISFFIRYLLFINIEVIWEFILNF